MSNKAIDVLVIDLTDELISDIVRLQEMLKSTDSNVNMGIQLRRSQGKTQVLIKANIPDEILAAHTSSI